jgi:uncharacterized repeat protein (TIGR03803 family)
VGWTCVGVYVWAGACSEAFLHRPGSWYAPQPSASRREAALVSRRSFLSKSSLTLRGQPLAGLIRDAAGNLYGTTLFGGIGGFEGVVFKLDRTGTETVLYSFTGGADGGNPYAPLIMDKKGNLYSTTNIGGDLNGCSGYGCGVVYKLTPSMTTRVD